MGVPFALDLSVKIPEVIKAVVVFYGSWAMDYGSSKAAYLRHFAEVDEFEPAENVRAFKESLKDAERPFQMYTYPGTGHWFMEPDREDAYQQGAAEFAWKRTLAFLKETL
jgi:carboxymethylenebutenolidase